MTVHEAAWEDVSPPQLVVRAQHPGIGAQQQGDTGLAVVATAGHHGVKLKLLGRPGLLLLLTPLLSLSPSVGGAALSLLQVARRKASRPAQGSKHSMQAMAMPARELSQAHRRLMQRSSGASASHRASPPALQCQSTRRIECAVR